MLSSPHSVIVFIEPGRRSSRREVVWAAQEQGGRCGAEHPGSLFAGLSRSLLLSHWVTLNEGST